MRMRGGGSASYVVPAMLGALPVVAASCGGKVCFACEICETESRMCVVESQHVRVRGLCFQV